MIVHVCDKSSDKIYNIYSSVYIKSVFNETYFFLNPHKTKCSFLIVLPHNSGVSYVSNAINRIEAFFLQQM